MLGLLKALPQDAAWIERQRAGGAWRDTNTFLDAVEGFLEDREQLSSEAYARLEEELNTRWAGILKDPDATKGKKKKPKYKDRPRKLAKRLLELRPK
jgi:hypothetical protein